MTHRNSSAAGAEADHGRDGGGGGGGILVNAAALVNDV